MSFLNSDIKLVMTRYKFIYLIIYIRPNKLKLKPEDIPFLFTERKFPSFKPVFWLTFVKI